MSYCEQSRGLVESSVLLWSGLILAFAALTACTFSRPEGVPVGQSCMADTECPDESASVCDLSGARGVCRQCTPARAEACTGTTPACGATNICEACASHSDCASDACLPSGACALQTEVVYLKQGGINPGGECTKDLPCSLLSTALLAVIAPRSYVRVSGTIMNADGGVAGRPAVLLGDNDGSSTLRGLQLGGGNEPVLFELGVNAQVEMHDLQLVAADGAAVEVNGAGATLLLNRSKILDADEEGIRLLNGVVTITDSEISRSGGNGGTPRQGINVLNGELSVTRSKISENEGGGVSIADGKKFSITNSFIVGNRGNGGLFLGTPSAGNKLEFNTIVDNQDGPNSADAGGVFCDQVGVVFSNNLIFRNIGGSGGSVQTFGSCTYGNSYVMSGTGVGDFSLAFAKDTAPRDYHLTAASPATVRDVAGLVCTGLKDVDGDERPLNGACDLGADEYKVP